MTEAALYADQATLIDALIKGHEAAFEWLVRQYYPVLSRVAHAIAGPEMADGIVQDAWIAILGGLAKFEGRASLKTWMCRIVANEAKRRLKKESRHASALVFDESGFNDRFDSSGHWSKPPNHWHHNSPESLLEEKQLQHCIEMTLAKLPEQYRAIFCLRYRENLPVEDICNILDLNNSNIRVILYRCRNRLFETIDHYQVTGEC